MARNLEACIIAICGNPVARAEAEFAAKSAVCKLSIASAHKWRRPCEGGMSPACRGKFFVPRKIHFWSTKFCVCFIRKDTWRRIEGIIRRREARLFYDLEKFANLEWEPRTVSKNNLMHRARLVSASAHGNEVAARGI